VIHTQSNNGELSKSEWPSIVEQYSSPSKQRSKLDLKILRVFGVEEKEAERMIQDLYSAISSSLETMQTTMEAD
jgi:hypothetical protein